MKFFKAAYIFIIVAICFCKVALAQANFDYDIVLIGGRVIDPETKLDTIKNVGIIKNRIAQISSEPLKGKEVINVPGK